MRTGATIAAALIAVAAPVVAWRMLLAPDRAPPEAPPRLRVEVLPRPAGVVGAPRAVAAAGDVLVACFDDGSLVVRRAGLAVRTVPPDEGEEFRRVAALEGGRVIALSQRGRLYEVRSGTATSLSLRAQVGSRMVAQPGADAVWIAGEAGGLRRLDVARRTIEDVGEGGEAPTGALAATASRAYVGRVDGVVQSGALGGALADVLRLPTGITALDASGSWVAVGTVEGLVRSKRPKTDPSGARTQVAGPVIALALPPPGAGPEEKASHEPLLVVHEPASATVFFGGTYERRETLALPGKPLCGCPLPDAHGLYVGLESGEEAIVRVAPASR
jgi:hypothetical protein